MSALTRLTGVKMDRAKALLVGSIMLVTFLAAVDATIVDTAMPSIIGSLGGVALYSWVFSAYLLTQTTTVPIYGKLADLFGRKRILLIGIFIFLAGSALCGAARSMVELVIFRGLQGLGAGAIIPITSVIIGDLFNPAERAKMQGVFSIVWAVSGLSGPLVGGLIVDHLSWRVIFYLNLPLGALAVAIFLRLMQEKNNPGRARIDYLGAIGLSLGTICLMLAAFSVGVGYGWTSLPVLGLLAVSAALYSVTIWWEGRTPEPILPLAVLRMPAVAMANLGSFLAGAVLIGINVYLPLYRQGVEGGTAIQAGLVLMPVAMGWPLSSWVGGRLVLRGASRAATILGSLCEVVAAAFLLFAARRPDLPLIALQMITFTVGLGMGFITLAYVLIAQDSVGRSLRGVVTASVTFVRSLGSTLGVSIMGTILNLALLTRLRAIPGLVPPGADARESIAVTSQLLDPAQWGRLPPVQVAQMRQALSQSLQGVYWVILITAILTLAAAFFLPNRRPHDVHSHDASNA